jgi:hypothetical protein
MVGVLQQDSLENPAKPAELLAYLPDFADSLEHATGIVMVLNNRT